MARTPKTDAIETADFVHRGSTRTNNPPARMAGEGRVPRVPKVTYRYNPHLAPVLRFDSTGKADDLDALITKAGKGPLTADEQRRLREALTNHQPWLEWANKQEQHDRGGFTVDPVVLHIHERLSTRAIIGAAMREDAQRKLFADPQQAYADAVKFYKHDVDWANRIILGDALQVMTSLAQRERLAGKVQMIYIDPPYGIKFGSNFQSEVGKRDVKDKDTDLPRQAEIVKAYRDTWTLGVHSYLSYLGERLVAAKSLLHESGSIFVQIGEENSHRVRLLMDEVFGAANHVSTIIFKKTGGKSSTGLAAIFDTIFWYARDAKALRQNQLFVRKTPGDEGATNYTWIEEPNGVRRPLTSEEQSEPPAGKMLQPYPMFSEGPAPGDQTFEWAGDAFRPSVNAHWKTHAEGRRRLAAADRLIAQGKTLRFVNYLEDYPVTPITNMWTDTQTSGFGDERVYVVQTLPLVIERCMLMSTKPGDLVLDPTCGSGTTALAAERWGRRWVMIDTSRVAVAIARQRLLTARFRHFRTVGTTPESGFEYRRAAHIKLGAVANNTHLDPIFARHQPVLDRALERATAALGQVTISIRRALSEKLAAKIRKSGGRSITEAEQRRWNLPGDRFEHWTMPFDADDEWPEVLSDAVLSYRRAWQSKMTAVDKCIKDNAEQEDLVDDPEPVEGVMRVSGPFTVEGVRPEELSLGEDGLFDGTPNEEQPGVVGESAVAVSWDADERDRERDNQKAYLDLMVDHLRRDGVTFPDNKHRSFARIEAHLDSGSLIHAEGMWEGSDPDERSNVAVGFGPQSGPVTALHAEELIHASRRYDELVIAGFSFEADAAATIKHNQHPRLRIHQAHIRPDINPGMNGLLKNTANSQLFTVFGTPEIALKPIGDEWVCELTGVDIYDPVNNVVRSTKAEKVAAWFLDSDFDGRCFCVTQAFFPDQDAWEKIAKALKGAADLDAFAAFSGTTSVPFKAGRHKRVAVKVVDPRGNEVMAIRTLVR